MEGVSGFSGHWLEDPGSGISGGNGAVWPLQRVYTAVCVSAGPGDQPCNSAGGPGHP